MKFALMPKEPTWWVWLVTVALLATGLAGIPAGIIAAITLSLVQTVFFWRKTWDVRAMSVQLRLAYTMLLFVCFTPPLRWLYWLPTVGTSALLVFGYCLMARTLSLLPWNRAEPLTLDLLCRTFFSPPVVTRDDHSFSACGGKDGVCELEASAASLRPRRTGAALAPLGSSSFTI
jgi:hypothetical protein